MTQLEKELVEALLFYADEAYYQMYEASEKDLELKTMIQADGGEKARQALANAKGTAEGMKV